MNLRKRRRRTLLLVLASALLLAAVLLLRFRYEPALSELAVTQVQNVTANIINAAVDEELAQGKLRYDRLISLQKTPDGRVSAMTADMYEINCLKSEILDLLSAGMQDVSNEELSIPLGSVVLPLLCSGHGPLIPVRYVAIRSSDAVFENEFSQAGINQTLHQINLRVDISVTVLLPTGTMDVTVSTDMAVAQTVIVGEVPQTVISMIGDQNGTER